MSTTPPLVDIGYVILFVRDVEKTAAFYRDKLGIPVKTASPEWTELETKGTCLALHRSEDGVPTGAAQAEVVFNAEDVRAAHAALVARDVPMGELKKVWEGGGVVGVASKFADPEGNRLGLHGVVPAAQWTD